MGLQLGLFGLGLCLGGSDLLGLVLLCGLAMLFLHVLNLDGEQLAILKGGLQRVAGIFCMHMGFDDLVIIHHHHAVANGLQEQPQVQGVLLNLWVPSHHELRAVGEVDLAVELRRHVAEELGGLLGLLLLGEAALQHNAAAEHTEHALEDAGTGPVRRHPPHRLFSARAAALGSPPGVGGAHAHGVPHLDGVAAQLQGFPAPLGGHPGHSEDGALGGFITAL